MSSTVTIVDYGSGNIFSVARALEHCGATVKISEDPAEIEHAERLLLPGVGAFGDGMRGLRERQLIAPIQAHAASGRPLLGICLGMQMLASMSTEFGEHEGLQLIPASVVQIPQTTLDGHPQRIPHIGWCELQAPAGVDWQQTALSGLLSHESVYMVHSFHLLPSDKADLLAVCDYGGHSITAAVKRGNVMGVQFHPEKSAQAGLRLLSHFIQS
jgi:glutamine amidotransferase